MRGEKSESVLICHWELEWPSWSASKYASVTSVACNLGEDPFRFHFNPEPPTEFLARAIMPFAQRTSGHVGALAGIGALLSGFMNNIGVAALMLPVVIDVARRTRIPASRLLMPLAYSTLLGGLMTLIGTPPNILVSDALRAGHGMDYYPGETNFRSADVLVINKVSGAAPGDIQRILDLRERLNPAAEILQSDLVVSADQPELLSGARVVIVEDGPTVTHGGMAYGAGLVCAESHDVAEIINPTPFAVGSIAGTLASNRHLKNVLPAMGYSHAQREELKSTIESCEPDVVIDASPADLGGLLDLSVPVVQVRYAFVPREGADLLSRVRAIL